MGIPQYFYTITQTYRGILHFQRPVKCHNLYFDYNGAVHHAVKTHINNYVKSLNHESIINIDNEELERNILDSVWKYTIDTINKITPANHIGIYMDGVAPIAKIQQQRKRRYLTYFRQKLLKTNNIWDTNAISPGTSFMSRLHAYIRNKIREEKESYKYSFHGSDEPGEGEHKIYANIASVPENENVFVHGLDADLIMLSLLSHKSNIYLMREPSPPYNEQTTEDGFIYLDIHSLRIAILKELVNNYKWNINVNIYEDPYSDEAKNCIETYVVLCFMLGNDFLPHNPSLSLKHNGYERLLKSAKNAWEIYPDGAVVNEKVYMPFIAAVLNILKSDENEIIWDINQKYMNRRLYVNDEIAKVDKYPINPENKHVLCKEIYNSSQTVKWRSLYYKHLFNRRLNDTQIIALTCKEYLTGICWTYHYYKRLPKEHNWYYPYGYPPSILDLSNYLEGTIETWEEVQDTWKNKKKIKWLAPVVQLLCILPKESINLLPKKYQKCMTDSSYGISYMYPEEYQIQTYLHYNLWECNPILPYIDVEWIESCVEKI